MKKEVNRSREHRFTGSALPWLTFVSEIKRRKNQPTLDGALQRGFLWLSFFSRVFSCLGPLLLFIYCSNTIYALFLSFIFFIIKY